MESTWDDDYYSDMDADMSLFPVYDYGFDKFSQDCLRFFGVYSNGAGKEPMMDMRKENIERVIALMDEKMPETYITDTMTYEDYQRVMDACKDVFGCDIEADAAFAVVHSYSTLWNPIRYKLAAKPYSHESVVDSISAFKYSVFQSDEISTGNSWRKLIEVSTLLKDFDKDDINSGQLYRVSMLYRKHGEHGMPTVMTLIKSGFDDKLIDLSMKNGIDSETMLAAGFGGSNG